MTGRILSLPDELAGAFQLSSLPSPNMNIWRVLGHLTVVVLTELLNNKRQPTELPK